jgi:pyridoxine kinase
MTMSAQRPAVIVVSSHVAHGGVGNRAAVFALERLGHPVMAIPTILLPFHPGHGAGTRIVAPARDFATLLDDLARSAFLDDVGGVLTGYLGEASQAAAIVRLVAAVKARRPDALYLCDPVLGDGGRAYRPADVVAAMRDRLAPLADILTPNRFELELLAGRAAGGEDDLIAAARELRAPEVVVTSGAEDETSITSLAVTRASVARAAHPRLGQAPHGTGDLFAALYLSSRLAGRAPAAALESAAGRVYRLAARADGRNELPLAEAQELILEGSEGDE